MRQSSFTLTKFWKIPFYIIGRENGHTFYHYRNSIYTCNFFPIRLVLISIFFHFCIIGGIEERKCHFGFAIRSRRPTASPCTSTGLQVTVNKFQIPIRETFSRSTSHHAPEFQTCFFENVKNRFGWSKNKQGSFSKPRLYLD